MKEFLHRLHGRLQHGLLIQEILDRVAKSGLVFYPYLLMMEAPDRPGSDGASPQGFSTRLLTQEDIPVIATIIERWRHKRGAADELQDRLRSGQLGIGLFLGSEFIGHTWCTVNYCMSIFKRKLFKLNPNEAYIFDTYIIPPYRGQGLAVCLRRALFAALVEEGRCTFYNVSLLFNASTRRFKTRLGSKEIELRLYLRFLGLGEWDLLLRRYLPRPPRQQPAIVRGQIPMETP
jgi:GNAT superfamily N-acetyltransferase